MNDLGPGAQDTGLGTDLRYESRGVRKSAVVVQVQFDSWLGLKAKLEMTGSNGKLNHVRVQIVYRSRSRRTS